MRFGIVGNISKQGTAPAISRLVEALRLRGLQWNLQDRLQAFDELKQIGEFVSREVMRETCDAVIVFGGNGTMLSTGRKLAGSNVPLLGFNLGKLGFLAEFSVEVIEETLDEFLEGSCRIVERTLLEASFPEDTGKTSLLALNDIVIDKRETRLMINLDVKVGGDYLGRYTADGLILATPTGSTAYALSVGGPVIAPDAGVFVIAPIAPHMLTARPVVIPDSATITITPTQYGGMGESIHVIADGQNHHFLELPSIIILKRHQHTVRLVKRASRTYFDVLRAKLLWGRRPSLDNEYDVTDTPS
ncbi:MAG: NAD(+)/NADH kinase [Chlorobi bacterium]|nr:NAD(+)/NADH kinase [Chlorobiota bacterium]